MLSCYINSRFDPQPVLALHCPLVVACSQCTQLFSWRSPLCVHAAFTSCACVTEGRGHSRDLLIAEWAADARERELEKIALQHIKEQGKAAAREARKQVLIRNSVAHLALSSSVFALYLQPAST